MKLSPHPSMLLSGALSVGSALAQAGPGGDGHYRATPVEEANSLGKVGGTG